MNLQELTIASMIKISIHRSSHMILVTIIKNLMKMLLKMLSQSPNLHKISMITLTTILTTSTNIKLINTITITTIITSKSSQEMKHMITVIKLIPIMIKITKIMKDTVMSSLVNIRLMITTMTNNNGKMTIKQTKTQATMQLTMLTHMTSRKITNKKSSLMKISTLGLFQKKIKFLIIVAKAEVDLLKCAFIDKNI